jgi:hypothetical protein
MQEKKDGKASVGMDNALMRCEFIEALVRVAVAKCGKGAPCHAPADAVEMLLRAHIAPNVAPLAKVDSNAFRSSRLYCEEVDALLKKWEPVLQALYSRWRLRPAGGGLRTKARAPLAMCVELCRLPAV